MISFIVGQGLKSRGQCRESNSSQIRMVQFHQLIHLMIWLELGVQIIFLDYLLVVLNPFSTSESLVEVLEYKSLTPAPGCNMIDLGLPISILESSLRNSNVQSELRFIAYKVWTVQCSRS